MHRASAHSTLLNGRPPAYGHDAVSFLVTFADGRIYAEPLNRRLTKREVARFLKTNEDGVAFLAKKGCLKALGHPEETKQKLFASNEFFLQMQDTRWLGKVTDLLYEFAEQRNAARSRRRHKAATAVAAESKP